MSMHTGSWCRTSISCALDYYMMTDRLFASSTRPVPASMSRTVSSCSSVSHMDLQIKNHWNDAVDPSTLVSRTASPMPTVSDEQLVKVLEESKNAPSALTAQQKNAHLTRLNALDIGTLSQDSKADLYGALTRPTREARRKGVVEFIRKNDGVIRWAASLRSLVESRVEEVS